MNIFTDDATGALISRIELARQSIATAGGVAIGSATFIRDKLNEAERLKDKEFQRTLELLMLLATPEQIKELHDRLDALQKRLDEKFEELEDWREDMDRRIALGIEISEEEQEAYNQRAGQLVQIQTQVIDAGRDTLSRDQVTVDEVNDLNQRIEVSTSILDQKRNEPARTLPTEISGNDLSQNRLLGAPRI